MRIHARVAAVITGCTLSFWAAPVRLATAQSPSPIPTNTVVVIERPISTEGLSVAVTAYVEVVGSEPETPAGSVDFFDADELLATASLETLQQRTGATIRVNLPTGVHPIIAKYRGDQKFAFSISTPPVPLEVVPLQPAP